jgi:RNase P protein component
MLKRGKRYHGKYLTFWIIPQYANNAYHQRAFQVPIKIDKRASMRNMLKRSCYQIVFKRVDTDIKHIKCFAAVNKKKAPELKELIATSDKNTIVATWREYVEKDLSYLIHTLS